jgi:hypothetical protein
MSSISLSLEAEAVAAVMVDQAVAAVQLFYERQLL